MPRKKRLNISHQKIEEFDQATPTHSIVMASGEEDGSEPAIAIIVEGSVTQEEAEWLVLGFLNHDSESGDLLDISDLRDDWGVYVRYVPIFPRN